MLPSFAVNYPTMLVLYISNAEIEQNIELDSKSLLNLDIFHFCWISSSKGAQSYVTDS